MGSEMCIRDSSWATFSVCRAYSKSRSACANRRCCTTGSSRNRSGSIDGVVDLLRGVAPGLESSWRHLSRICCLLSSSSSDSLSFAGNGDDGSNAGGALRLGRACLPSLLLSLAASQPALPRHARSALRTTAKTPACASFGSSRLGVNARRTNEGVVKICTDKANIVSSAVPTPRANNLDTLP